MSTDPTGAVVETCTNLPFGDDGSCTGANASLISFTDFDHDSESNLEHAWFRQLSTTLGRWMTPDPYSGSMDLSNPQSLNRYAYVGNDPVSWFDPLGLAAHEAKCISDQGCDGTGGGGGRPTCLLDGAEVGCDFALQMVQGGSAWIVTNGANIIRTGDWAGCYLNHDKYFCPENASVIFNLTAAHDSISADNSFFNFKRTTCMKEAGLHTVAAASGYDLAVHVRNAMLGDFGELTLHDSAHAGEVGAEFLSGQGFVRKLIGKAPSQAVRRGIMKAFKFFGGKTNSPKIIEGAEFVGKRAGLVALLLLSVDAGTSYNECMAQ